MHKGRDWFEATADLWNKHGSESQREHEIERERGSEGGEVGVVGARQGPRLRAVYMYI